MTRKFPDWPAWFFGPDGAAGIFERVEDVPEGWVGSFAEAEVVFAPKPAGAVLALGVDANRNGYESLAEIKQALADGVVSTEEVRTAEMLRSRPRVTVLQLLDKLEVVSATPPTPSVDDAAPDLTREEAIALVRGAGAELADDATDAEIEAALTALEAG